MKEDTPIIGFDAKRAVANGTGLGSYSRTLINDLARYPLTLRLYAPDEGRDDLRTQIQDRANVTLHTPHSSLHTPHSTFHIPHTSFLLPPSSFLGKSYWRSHGIVSDLRHDGIQLYHGLSGELPIGIRKSGIPSVVTIHDLIFLRHPEYYHWIDTKIYAWKFRQTISEATHIIAISECTRRDILHYAPELDPARISVIYQSCAPKFTPDISPSSFLLPPSSNILRYFGGFEMVTAIGAMLRAAERKMLVMVDGFIMTACALGATQLYPQALNYMIFGHCGDESGHKRMLDLMHAEPLLHLGMRLGEGTGALCSYPIIVSAVNMMNEMNNFENANITKYF